jgi:DNA mismatch repair ATPase MutL
MPLSHFATPADANNNQLTIIDNSFAFIKKNSQYLLINLNMLVNDIFIALIEKCQTNDECISPLLVSEPFQARNTSIDLAFELTKTLGFEFDRLSAEVIILRTIPKNLPRAILPYVASTLIDYFTHHRGILNKSLLENYLHGIKETNIHYNIQLVETLLELTHFENKNFAIILNKSNLGLFFK